MKKVFLCLVVLILMVRYLLPEGRGWNMWWPGCKGSARMPLARFLALEVWMSWREGRLQPMIFSAERTMRCSLSLSLSLGG